MKKPLSSSSSSSPIPTSPSSSTSSSSSSTNATSSSLLELGSKSKTKLTSRRTSNTDKTQCSSHGRRSSMYRGVTRHRWTGRYEAHLWDKSSWNPIQNKKGKQVYLGAYDDEEAAAHTYDLAALKYWGTDTILNFPLATYSNEYEEMQTMSREEYLASLRRRSSGFSRGVSKYRGVARHHHNGRWEARIGRVLGNKYLYLGTFSTVSNLVILLLYLSFCKLNFAGRTQEEAAQAYDRAAIEYRGMSAVTNFDISCYMKCPQQQQQLLSQPRVVQEVKPLRLEPTPSGPTRPLPLPPISTKSHGMTPSHVAHLIDPSMAATDDNPPGGDNPWSLCMEDAEFNPYNDSNMGMAIDKSSDLHNLFCDSGFEDDIEHLFEETDLFSSTLIENETNSSGIPDELGSMGPVMVEEEKTEPSSPAMSSASYSLPISIYS